MQTVLVIANGLAQVTPVISDLEVNGYSAQLACNGTHGMVTANQTVPDLILLDMSLSDMPGTEVCRLLKNKMQTGYVPIIMLNSRTEDDVVLAFEAGADDCLAQHCSNRELILRVGAILHRTGANRARDSLINAGPITIDANRHTVLQNGIQVVCTGMEFKLLQTLIARQGKVQSRDVLLRDVWGYSYVEDTRTIDTHITRLRIKLGEAGDLIKTVRGFGYMFVVNPGW
jgi:two-component system, OmpR family, phosphate regulon response regulator PhoB